MEHLDATYKSREELLAELEELRHELYNANETIEAIRTGRIDALVVHGDNGAELYTLKTADQTYRVFIETMTEGAVTLNPQGIILYSNSQFATLVDKPLSGVFGFSFDSFVSEESHQKYISIFSDCWKRECTTEILLTSGKKQVPVKLSTTTLDLAGVLTLSIIVTDLTAQKEAQQILRENNEELEATNRSLERSNIDLQQFASVASHDLQEPLRKIQIFSGLLHDRENNFEPELRTYLRKIINSASRMRALISDVLSYSRLSSTKTAITCVNLTEMIDELLEDFELIINEKKAEITMENLQCIDANRGQIRQVFQNLISNSLKFSKKDITPRIHVKAKEISERSFDSSEQPGGPYCMVSVTDNGIGFDDKYMNEIFELFQRLNNKDNYEGTGIGLSIAKKIIEKHHGIIRAVSKPGQGATFDFILPVKQPD